MELFSKRSSFIGMMLLSVSGAAVAANSDVPTGFYLGGGLGRATVSLETPDFRNDYEGESTSKRVFAGYRFIPYVAAEVAYDDFGESHDDIGDRFTSVDLYAKFHSFSAGPVGMLPLGPVDLKVKLALTSWKGTIGNRGFGVREDFDNVDASLGFGVQYRIKRLAIRSDLEVHMLGFDDDGDDEKDFDDNVANLSFGVSWTF